MVSAAFHSTYECDVVQSLSKINTMADGAFLTKYSVPCKLSPAPTTIPSCRGTSLVCVVEACFWPNLHHHLRCALAGWDAISTIIGYHGSEMPQISRPFSARFPKNLPRLAGINVITVVVSIRARPLLVCCPHCTTLPRPVTPLSSDAPLLN